MASGNTTPTTARNTCKHPGCGEPAAPATGPGRPPEYCEGRGHTKVTAWRERRRLAAAEAGTTASPADTDNPVTMARVTGAELLRALRAEADRVSGIADRLRRGRRDGDRPDRRRSRGRSRPRRRRAARRGRRGPRGRRRAARRRGRPVARRSRRRRGGDGRAAGRRPGPRRPGGGSPRRRRNRPGRRRSRQARQDAATRIAAAEADRDAAIAQARAEASQQVSAAEADRDQARDAAAQAEQAARLAQQEAARALAAAEAARAETGRVRADADKMLAGFRADAARDRDELRADLRARAERAEQQADAYRDELAQLRAETQPRHATQPPTTGRHGAPGRPPSRSPSR